MRQVSGSRNQTHMPRIPAASENSQSKGSPEHCVVEAGQKGWELPCVNEPHTRSNLVFLSGCKRFRKEISDFAIIIKHSAAHRNAQIEDGAVEQPDAVLVVHAARKRQRAVIENQKTENKAQERSVPRKTAHCCVILKVPRRADGCSDEAQCFHERMKHSSKR